MEIPKIVEISISGYKSLNQVKLVDCKNLNVFIGPNHSGKSNILEAIYLFFRDSKYTRNLKVRETITIDDIYLQEAEKRTDITVTFEISEAKIRFFRKKIEELVREHPQEDTDLIYTKVTDLLGDFKEFKVTKVFDPQTPRLKEAYFHCGTLKALLEENWKISKIIKPPLVISTKIEGKPAETRFSGNEYSLHPFESVAYSILATILQELINPIKKGFIFFPEERILSTETGNDTFQSYPHQLLLFNGRNVKKILSTWFRGKKGQISDYREKSSRFKDLLSKFPNLDFDIAVTDDDQNNLHVVELFNGKDFTLDFGGRGSWQIITFFVGLIASGANFILIDEPETYLHPSFQRQLLHVFQEEFSRNQFFISTHSPVFIETNKDNQTYIIDLSQKETRIIPFETEEDKNLLKKLLGVRYKDGFFPEYLLIMEGKSELEIEKLFLHAGHRLAGMGTSILPVDGGISKLQNLAELLKKLRSLKISFIIVFDGDQRILFGKIANKIHISDEEVIFLEKDWEYSFGFEIFLNGALKCAKSVLEEKNSRLQAEISLNDFKNGVRERWKLEEEREGDKVDKSFLIDVFNDLMMEEGEPVCLTKAQLSPYLVKEFISGNYEKVEIIDVLHNIVGQITSEKT